MNFVHKNRESMVENFFLKPYFYLVFCCRNYVLTNFIPRDGFNDLRKTWVNENWAIVISFLRVIFRVQWNNMCLFKLIGEAR